MLVQWKYREQDGEEASQEFLRAAQLTSDSLNYCSDRENGDNKMMDS